MTKFVAGQMIRAQWKDNSGAIEGVLYADRAYAGGLVLRMRPGFAGSEHLCPMSIEALLTHATVTVLFTPRPEEPTGLGAVVKADYRPEDGFTRTEWIRLGDTVKQHWVDRTHTFGLRWDQLVDPVTLSDGWEPPSPTCICGAAGPEHHHASCPLSEERAE